MGSKGYKKDDFQVAVTAEIRAEAAARRWTQTELARRAGMPSASISRYLSDVRGMPIGELARIARALGVEVSELARRAEDRLSRGRPVAAAD